MTSSIEKINGSTFLVQPQTRKNNGASATMRKYQQLALTIVSVISLMAFLFYKHEYDRMRYTLEYLEMFGNGPTDVGASPLCGSSTMLRKINTAPHVWVKLKNDVAVYSAFWDEGNGLVNPLLRTLAAIKKSKEPQTELLSSILFETGEIKMEAICSVEEIFIKKQEKKMALNDELRIAHIVCRPEDYVRKVPYLTQFKIGGNEWSSPLFVQDSESWKSVSNSTCLCLYSKQFPISNLKLIEFITYYNVLGVEKFVFYGSLLTPLVRKLLNKYGDESNIFFEEKSFLIPEGFSLDDAKLRGLIESDCLYRHRDNYENVLVLNLNEYLIPRNKISLQEVLTAVGGKSTATISEFSFVSQSVCVDDKHSKNSDLLLNSQIRILDSKKEVKSVILRPHLVDTVVNARISALQNVPSAVATIYSFEICSAESHADTDHLPSIARFVDLIKKSLLFRKWKINS